MNNTSKFNCNFDDSLRNNAIGFKQLSRVFILPNPLFFYSVAQVLSKKNGNIF